MKRYKGYINSNVKLLGEIPSHWKLAKLNHLVSETRPVTYGIVQAGPKLDQGIAYVRPADMTSAGIPPIEQLPKTSPEIALPYRRSEIYEKDIVVSIGPSFGKLAIVKAEHNGLNLTQGTARIAANGETDHKYLYWILKSNSSWHFWNRESVGATFSALSLETLKKTPVAYTADELEQTQIARYLDYKTAKIDALIKKKQRLIELLEEERTAIINEMVTGKKVWDGHAWTEPAEVKDSGIEWMGEIPEHWEVKKLKYLLKEKKGSLKTGPFGSHIKNSDYIENGDYKVYTQRNVLDNEYHKGSESISSDKFDELRGFKIYPNDILITTRGTIGRCSLFPEDAEEGVLHPCLIRVQLNETICVNQWLMNYINETSLFFNNVKYNSNSTVIDVIYGYTLKEIYIPTPPVEEQLMILETVTQEFRRIQKLIEKVTKEIALLREYKTALISEVVTGKVDVRDEVIPE